MFDSIKYIENQYQLK